MKISVWTHRLNAESSLAQSFSKKNYVGNCTKIDAIKQPKNVSVFIMQVPSWQQYTSSPSVWQNVKRIHYVFLLKTIV